jgi:ribonucleoside-triphosphate reductase
MAIPFIFKRDGSRSPFAPNKITNAIRKAFLAQDQVNEPLMELLTEDVIAQIQTLHGETTPSVEEVQDIVEAVLIQQNYAAVAKAYILYREKHKEIRQQKTLQEIAARRLKMRTVHGQWVPFDPDQARQSLQELSQGISTARPNELMDDLLKLIHDGMSTEDLHHAMVAVVKRKM